MVKLSGKHQEKIEILECIKGVLHIQIPSKIKWRTRSAEARSCGINNCKVIALTHLITILATSVNFLPAISPRKKDTTQFAMPIFIRKKKKRLPFPRVKGHTITRVKASSRRCD